MRTTLLGLGMFVLLCGAGIFGVYTYFGRDAQMREAELMYNTKYADRIARTQASAAARALAEKEGTDTAFNETTEDLFFEEDVALDDWYDDADATDEPFDPSPEDDSYLIDDTLPFE